MNQVDVKDFSLSEPDLASIVKQIYNGALGPEVGMMKPPAAIFRSTPPWHPPGVMNLAYSMWVWADSS